MRPCSSLTCTCNTQRTTYEIFFCLWLILSSLETVVVPRRIIASKNGTTIARSSGLLACALWLPIAVCNIYNITEYHITLKVFW